MNKEIVARDFNIKFRGEEYRFVNNYKNNTAEYTLYNNVLKAILQMKYMNTEPWKFDESILFGDVRCLRNNVNKAFVKLSLSNGPLEFSISEYEYNVYESLETSNRDEHEDRYKRFISNIKLALELLHKTFIFYSYQVNRVPKVSYDEQAKQKLLSEASIDRPKSLNQIGLAIELNDFFLTIPRTMTFEDMYYFYLMNLPNKKIKYITNVPKQPKVIISKTKQTQANTKTFTSEASAKSTSNSDKKLESFAEHVAKLNANKDKPKVEIIKEPIKTNPFKEFSNNAEVSVSPWTSAFKANDYMKHNNWTDSDVEDWRNKKHVDSFNFKQQSKDYMLKTVAPRYSFIIDYFDPSNNKITYLLAVNINTRKAYAIATPDKTFQQGSKWIQNKEGNKSLETAVKQLDELLKQTTVKHILCDQEKAFTSPYFHEECKKNGIEIQHYIKNNVKGLIETSDESRGNHGSLAILDRLCRTIRRMNYNIGNGSNAITPPLMQKLLDEYNRSPHTTLTKILGFPASPNVVDSDKHLEDIVVWTALRHNLKIKMRDDFNIVGKIVMCVNESGKFDKLKSKLLPGKWIVSGVENGLFVCKRLNNFGTTTNQSEIIKLPRYMIKVVDPF